MDILDVLTGNMPDNPALAAQLLRRQQALGTLGQMSGVPALQNIGRSTAASALTAGSALMEARAQAERAAAERAARAEVEAQRLADRQEARALQLALAQMSADTARARIAAQADAKQAAADKPAPPTAGQQQLDKAAAADYVQWTTRGRQQVVQDIESLSTVLDVLERRKTDRVLRAYGNLPEDVSGGLPGALPVEMRAILKPASADIQRRVERVTARDLRELFGAQFAFKEGQLQLERTYDPRNPEAINANSVRTLLRNLQDMLAEKDRQTRYFEQYGTMRGYRSSNSRLPGEDAAASPQGPSKQLLDRAIEEAARRGLLK